MPSSDYETIRIYLHRERDKKLLYHLKELPRYLRQAFMRESLESGMDQTAGESGQAQSKKTVPQGFKKYGAAEG